MNKTLKLLIDDFQNQKPGAEYQFVLHQFCDAEFAFMATLNKEQETEYLRLDVLGGELGVAELDGLAIFLFENLQQ